MWSAWLLAGVLGTQGAPGLAYLPCAHFETHALPWTATPSDAAGEIFWVIERGSHLRVQAGGLPLEVASGPSRFGWLPIHLAGQDSMRVEGTVDGPGEVQLGRVCTLSEAELAWWQTLNRLAATRTGLAQVLPALERHLRPDAEGMVRAAQLHVRAFQRAAAGRADLARSDYEAAAADWLALGDVTRAGAAALGAAQNGNAAGRSADALHWARQAQQWLSEPVARMFHDMAAHSECVALQSLGALQEAVECLIRVDQLQAEAGDANGRANALVTLAQVQYSLGQHADAYASERLAMAIPATTLYPLVRGRVLLHAARRLGDEGRITPAIDTYAEALRQFTQAGDAGRAMEIEALSKLVRLYAKLGMAETAYRTVTRMLQTSPAEQDPVQVAILLNTLSHVEEAGERPQAAVRWVHLAEQIYRWLDHPAGVFENQLRELEIRVSHGLDLPEANALPVLQSTPHSVVDEHRLRLLAAVEAERQGLMAEADRMLAAVLDAPQDVGQRNQGLMVLARVWQARGRLREAYQRVADGIRNSAAEARGATHVGQAWLAMRAAAGLRPLLVDLWTLQDTGERVPEQLWADWAAALPAQAIQPMLETADDAAEFAVSEVVEEAWRLRADAHATADLRVDGALARALLGDAQTGSAVHLPVPTLAGMQTQLRPGDLLLVIASGSQQSVRLALRADQVQTDTLPGRETLLGLVNDLATRVQDPGSALIDIERAGQPVAHWLFGGLGKEPPRRLLVLADDLLLRVPVAVLHWPGTVAPLSAQTGVSWVSDVRAGLRPAMPAFRPDRHLRIVIAGRPEASGDRLRPLDAPELEAEGIRARMDRFQVSTFMDHAAHRGTLLEALRSRDDWVHLASHGWSEPGLLGQAGVWLAAPEATGQPQFLSWLDVAGHPLAADLAVLNACQTAAVDPQAVREGSMSFAASISAAGVRNTVASFWPISDPAVAIWVPVFYDAMQGRDADASLEATRMAQESLRHSRLYGHPYYWASLGHFQRLDVPSAP